MATTAGKFTQIALATGITLMLTGCGLSQKVTDGAVAATRSIFYKQVKALHLDIRAREAVNSNAGGVALSTVVRIYQLKDRKTFDSTDYPSLFKADNRANSTTVNRVTLPSRCWHFRCNWQLVEQARMSQHAGLADKQLAEQGSSVNGSRVDAKELL